MEKKMSFESIIGIALLIVGGAMVIVGKEPVQIGGLVMIITGLGSILKVRLVAIEKRLNTLEGKPTS